MKRLVIFDLDGTLLDTIQDLGEAVNHALASEGLPLHGLEEFPSMVGRGIRNLVKRALPGNLQADDAYIDKCLAIFKDYYSGHIDVHTRPYPGMQAFLRDLHNRGIRLSVLSNKFQEGAEVLVNEFFGDIPFACVLGNREGYPLKPDPAVVDEILARAGMQKHDAVLVGDSIPDMRTAQNARIDAIAVTWGYCPAEDLSGYRLVSSPEELRDLILTW